MTDQPRPPAPTSRRRGLPVGALVGAAALLCCFGVLYGMDGAGKKASGACPGAPAAVARLDPLVHGEVAAFSLAKTPRVAPDIAFKDEGGRGLTLADFRGRTVLLNLWATWCIPCRQEMPALDRLQARLGGADFQVVAVNIDTVRLERPKAFLADAGVTHLPLYADPSARAFQVLRADRQATGLPTTLVIDRDGCQLGEVAGPAGWDSPEAVALITAAKQS